MKLQFIGNVGNPESSGMAEQVRLVLDYRGYEGVFAERLRRHLRWLSDKVLGQPREMLGVSPERLQALGIVGVYQFVPNDVQYVSVSANYLAELQDKIRSQEQELENLRRESEILGKIRNLAD